MRTVFIILLTMLTMLAHAQEKKATKKHFWHTVETTASPDKIWAVWADVQNWKTWDTGLKVASMRVPFTLNAKGNILSLEDRKSTFKIVAFEQGKTYTFKTNLPLGGLYVKRTLEVKNGRTFFTHEVWFSGLTGGFFANMFGEKFKQMLPEVMENIKKIVEKP
jgi:Polyketide cyclase / dehydrase and lipid transport